MNENVTTWQEMRNLRNGDVFYVNGEKHIAADDSHLSGDASYDGYVVYDENGESFFETDFPADKNGWMGYGGKTTSRARMKELCEGDTFWVNGEKHIASCDADLCGDSDCEEYTVYDEDGECYFETDFPVDGYDEDDDEEVGA